MAKRDFEIIARGVILSNNHVLLCRPKGESYSFLPGGHVEFFESSEMAVIREVKEELGIKTKIQSYVGTLESAFYSTKKHHELNVIFLLKHNMKYSKKVKSVESHIEFFWCHLKKLKNANCLPSKLATVLPRWVNEADKNWCSDIRD